ncbi:hypothetical protein ABZ917_17725 [Nonomuraea wenchangensis]
MAETSEKTIAPHTVTLPEPCWIRPGEYWEERHWPSRDGALACDDPNDPDWTPPSEVRQLDQPCVVLPCVCCGDNCDYPGECAVYHSRSVENADEAARASGWERTADGWKCSDCATGGCGCRVGTAS